MGESEQGHKLELANVFRKEPGSKYLNIFKSYVLKGFESCMIYQLFNSVTMHVSSQTIYKEMRVAMCQFIEMGSELRLGCSCQTLGINKSRTGHDLIIIKAEYCIIIIIPFYFLYVRNFL